MLTTDQILALSPDEASAKAAKGLLNPAKWPTLGRDEIAIWGECQGSGSKPYQVIIDTGGPTFKCSCPSRKFPCKHGLALYLLLAQKESTFSGTPAPTWVGEWLSARQQRAEKKVEKAAQAEVKPADPAVAAKREAKRVERMLGGAQELERWLSDLIRHGIAGLPAKPASFWREAAARLVDAQAGGLATLLRQLEGAVASGEGWHERALQLMGRLQLVLEAMHGFETLPEPLRCDVRSTVGWPLDKEEVLSSGERVHDVWQVLGISHDENERLWERRVWLRARESDRAALLLDFSHGGRRFDQLFLPGAVFRSTLCFFPSAFPLRALLVDGPAEEDSLPPIPPLLTWDAALERVADAVSHQPFFQRLPLRLDHAVPVMRNGSWLARDEAGREAPLRLPDEDGWQLLALSGGRPLNLFGEWHGEFLRPLSAWIGNSSTPCWSEGVNAA